MANLDFQQKVEELVQGLFILANKYLTGDYDVTVIMQRVDVDDVGGAIMGTGDNEDALEVLEDNLEEDESDLVVRSR
jgi:hypothetical protein